MVLERARDRCGGLWDVCCAWGNRNSGVSNDTRVRVDGRSKIIASVLPASGRSLPERLALMARARSINMQQAVRVSEFTAFMYLA